MFILVVAAELYGNKHNIEIGFPERPSLADFIGHCEATFRGEVTRIRPSGAPLHRFVIDSVKIFDDTLNRWVDLASAHQLVEWSQLYLFQPSVDPSNPNEESQAILRPPVRIRSPMEVGRNKEKFFFLFHDMDFNGNGHLNRDEVQRIFNVMGCFEISEKAIDQMFLQFDTNRDGVLSFAEFTKWMTAKSDVAEMLLKKSLEYWQSWRQRRPEIRDSSEVSAQEKAAIEQYLERCRASQSNPTAQARIRTIKEVEDERLLLEREEELRRARDSFKSTYGRELGVPSTTSTLMVKAASPSAPPTSSSSHDKHRISGGAAAGGGNSNNSMIDRHQHSHSHHITAAAASSSSSSPSPSLKRMRATTPTVSSSGAAAASTTTTTTTKPKPAFGTTMDKTTPRPQSKASTAPKKRDVDSTSAAAAAAATPTPTPTPKKGSDLQEQHSAPSPSPVAVNSNE